MNAENPFKGPKSYEDGDDFHGREKEIKDVYNLIKNEPLTLLFSRSGTGKSSLLKAGLMPYLRKEYDFLPVYVHLNDTAVKQSSAANLCDFVIKRCEEEIKKYLSNLENFKTFIPERKKKDSLFEFFHTAQLIQIERSENIKSLEYVIKPVLIFDQFEEIFTHPFNKDNLQSLVYEIQCLLESRIPDYLNETFATDEDEYYLKIKESLRSKQKNFRILFAFREEYLPQFESLKKEISLIRFTSSRYRLEAFSIETSEEVIMKTAPDVSKSTSNLVSQNLAINILSNFDRIIVEPFLLSLVCKKIYSSIVGNTTETIQDTADRVKLLVNHAIENYIDEVYIHIGEKTKKFIEKKLITSDNKRTPSNYTDAIKDPDLKNDIDKLIDIPEYRLLNKEQFLDSTHIEILHDRLLPPIAQRRDVRTKKAEDDALMERQKDLENQLNIKNEETRLERKRKKHKINLASLAVTACILALAATSFYNKSKALSKANMEQSKLITKNTDLIHALAIQKEDLDIANKNLSNNNDSLHKTLTRNDSLAASLRTVNDTLTLLNKSLESTKNNLTSEKNNLSILNNNKTKFLSFFKSQSDSLISILQRENPFSALALAQTNYEQISSLENNDTLIQIFKKKMFDVYDNTEFFYKTSFTPEGGTERRKNDLFTTIKEDRSVLYLYKVSNKIKLLDSIVNFTLDESVISKNNDAVKIAPEISVEDQTENILQHYDFSDDGTLFYTITKIKGIFFLHVWKIFNNGAITKAWDDVIPAIPNSTTRFFFKKDIISFAYKNNEKKSYEILCIDINKKKKETFFFKINSISETISDIENTKYSIITRRTYPSSQRLYNNTVFSLYDANNKRDTIVSTKNKTINSVIYSGGNMISVATLDDESDQIEFRDLNGKIYDSVILPKGFYSVKYIYEKERIIAFDNYYQMVIMNKEKDKWKNTAELKSNFKGLLYGVPYFSSLDNNLLAYTTGPNTIGVFNLNSNKIIKTISLPDKVRYNPVLAYYDSTIHLYQYNKFYSMYFNKPIYAVTSVKDLEEKIKRMLSNDWKLYVEEKSKYIQKNNK